MKKILVGLYPGSGKKIGIDTLISWGATIVIVGLTFKLLHWPGGEWMIGVGLTVEAFLFFILGVNAMKDKEEEEQVVVRQATPQPQTNELEQLLNQSINPVTIQRLSEGFEQFNKTVESVNHVVGYNEASRHMIQEVELATKELVQLRSNLEEINKVYRAQIDAFKKN